MDCKSIKVFSFVAGAIILVLSGRDIEAGVIRSEESDQVATTTPPSQDSLNNATVYYLIGNLVGTALPPTESTVQTNANKTSPNKRRKRITIRKYKYTFGKRTEGDRQLFELVIRKPIIFGVDKIIVNVPFPEKNKENDCPITHILVRNAQTVGDLENDDVLITSGGISQTHVTVKIISPNFYLYSYRVLIYGKCN